MQQSTTAQIRSTVAARFSYVEAHPVNKSTIRRTIIKEKGKITSAHFYVEDENLKGYDKRLELKNKPQSEDIEWYLRHFIYIYNLNDIKNYYKYPWSFNRIAYQ